MHSLGRSMKRDIQIKLKAVSADHCAINYAAEKGWTITERGKDRLSSNGTFIFMKSMTQMNNHVPSDMIPLHDEMVISFVNYELKVSLLQKTRDDVDKQTAAMEEFFAAQGQAVPVVEPAGERETPQVIEGQPTYTAEVQQNEQPPAEEGEAPAENNDATEDEKAAAATKIAAVHRGKKAREEVAAMRDAKASAADGEGEKPADDAPAEDAPADDPPADAAPEEQPAADAAKEEEEE